jgi:hypothetical protein
LRDLDARSCKRSQGLTDCGARRVVLPLGRLDQTPEADPRLFQLRRPGNVALQATASRSPAQLPNRNNLFAFAFLCCIVVLGAPIPALAESDAARPTGIGTIIEEGAALPKLDLTDQHDKPGLIDGSTRILLFAPDRESSKLAHTALEPIGGAGLAKAGAVYVADISRMPGFITRTLALPKMRKYSYPVLLGREDAEIAALPRQTGKITLLRAVGGRVTNITFINSAESLTQALRQE